MNLSPVLRGWFPLLRGSAVLLLVLFAAGCGREEIRVYQVPKDEPWKLPPGWQERQPGNMRAAQFVIPSNGKSDTDVSLIPIRGTMARPEMKVDIVNIWRQQMQLDPVEGTTLAASAQKVPVGREDGELYEMVSNEPATDQEKPRSLVAAVQADNTLWLIKMTGEDSRVAEQKPAFLAFLKSLNLDAMPSPEPPTAHAASTNVREPSREAKPRPEWTLPPGWSEAPPSQMLLAKFVVGQPEGKAEMTVSAFPGAAGGVLANINRWRNQLKLQPVEETELEKLVTSLDLPSGKAMLVDMTGTDAKTGQPARIIGAIQERDGLTWFYKLMGDEPVAAREKTAFLDFLKTVKYPNG